MTAKEIEMALQPFRTVESINGFGVGMGLAIAKRITELQGGELIIESDSGDSMGLKVTAKLPKNRILK